MDALASLDWATIGDYIAVFLLGAVVSSGELISRYRDEPFATLRSRAALFYMLVNGLASMGALTLVRAFNLSFGASGNGVRLMQILVAGFGAMAVFRSSIFTVRIEEKDVPIGAASFLTIVLDAADREVDRQRAALRAQNVGRIMSQVDFKKALASLPTYSIALMQNLPPDEQEKLAGDVAKLAKFEGLDDPVKAQILGLAVMNFMGEDVLSASIEALKNEIKSTKVTEAKQSEGGLDLEKILERVRGSGDAENTQKDAPSQSTPSVPSTLKAPPPDLAAPPTTEKGTTAETPSFDIDALLKRAKEQADANENQAIDTDPAPTGDKPADPVS